VTLPVAAPSGGTIVTLSSNLPNAAAVPASVTVPAGARTASFAVTTFQVAPTTAQLSARNGDTILFAALGITTAAPAPALSALTLTPSSVPGGNSSIGKVTLTAPAPSGGAKVTLSSSRTATATVPASVTVAAGSTSATFTVSTTAVAASTPVTISSDYAGGGVTATLTVTPPGASATLSVTATGRTGTRITSNPAGIDVTVGSTGAAPFAVGTKITLTAGGRSAVWSGACSSNGAKTSSCTFTLSGNASVAVKVN
jgi:hypothetical protein